MSARFAYIAKEEIQDGRLYRLVYDREWEEFQIKVKGPSVVSYDGDSTIVIYLDEKTRKDAKAEFYAMVERVREAVAIRIRKEEAELAFEKKWDARKLEVAALEEQIQASLKGWESIDTSVTE